MKKKVGSYEDFVKKNQHDTQEVQSESKDVVRDAPPEDTPAKEPVDERWHLPPDGWDESSKYDTYPTSAFQVAKVKQGASYKAILPSGQVLPGNLNLGTLKAKKKPRGYGLDVGGYSMEEAPFLEASEKLKEDTKELLPEMESQQAETPSDREMFDNVRDDLLIFRSHERTIVYALAVDKTGENNQMFALRCFGGVAFGCYPHDTGRDAYLADCMEYIHIGTIPFAIRVGESKVKIPIPDKVLERSFTPNQRKMVQLLKEKYPEYEIRYLQMLGAN